MKTESINTTSFGLNPRAKRLKNSRLLKKILKSDFLYVSNLQKDVYVGVSVHGNTRQRVRVTPQNVTYEKVSKNPQKIKFRFIKTHKNLRQQLFDSLSKPFMQ